MKRLQPHNLNAQQARHEWREFDQLLTTNAKLSENKHVLPFFKTRHDLSSLISFYFPQLANADVIAHEFPIVGDFRADLVVGDSSKHEYVLVEFENGAPDSIFRKNPTRATPDWSPRFEAAFSQLVDWLHSLDGLRNTPQFDLAFGDRDASFQGLIVLGKGTSHTKAEQSRLKWRIDHVLVDSNRVSVVTFEDLRSATDSWLAKYYGV